MTDATWRGAVTALFLSVKHFSVVLHTREIWATQEVEHGPTSCLPPVCGHLGKCQFIAAQASSAGNMAAGLLGCAKAVVWAVEPSLGLETFFKLSWALCRRRKFSCLEQVLFSFFLLWLLCLHVLFDLQPPPKKNVSDSPVLYALFSKNVMKLITVGLA